MAVLFRKGFLRVVVATGTLALGINMPCKTVVFSGDSIFLTALNFRQASGRAGRRGFDMLGNVVFQGVPYAKICRLISSRLPGLNGHFPVTTSLVLRLFILLHESKQAAYAVKAINSILSCPRIYLGGAEMKDTVLHHLRFSIEYLRRNKLLDSAGVPLNFAGCVSHLYYTESSSFAFHALLEAGYFHGLCRSIDLKPKQTVLTLMLVMSHIFGHLPLRQSIFESQQVADKKSSSIVVLPPMPKKAANILHSHNKKTLDIYAAYVTTFIEQHIQDPDCTLPLSSLKCGGDKSPVELGFLFSSQPPARTTSSFFALSGHCDKWNSVSDLCKMVRSGVWLEEAVAPYVAVHPEESQTPLNAYLYDFFNHGNVHELERANGIRRGDIWFVLNDFSLVLATIVTSLENFLKFSHNMEADMLDVMGGGDEHEIELDNKVIEAEFNVKSHGAASPKIRPVHQKQSTINVPLNETTQVWGKKIVDSWDDDLTDDAVDKISNDKVMPDSPNDIVKKKQNDRAARKIKATKTETQRTKYEAANTEVSNVSNSSIILVIKAFKVLQDEFNQKFRAMWT
jgi:ATP-dependent RNA helicase DDX60